MVLKSVVWIDSWNGQDLVSDLDVSFVFSEVDPSFLRCLWHWFWVGKKSLSGNRGASLGDWDGNPTQQTKGLRSSSFFVFLSRLFVRRLSVELPFVFTVGNCCYPLGCSLRFRLSRGQRLGLQVPRYGDLFPWCRDEVVSWTGFCDTRKHHPK